MLETTGEFRNEMSSETQYLRTSSGRPGSQKRLLPVMLSRGSVLLSFSQSS